MAKLTYTKKSLFKHLSLFKDSKGRLCIKGQLSEVVKYISKNYSLNSLKKFLSSIHTVNTNQYGTVIKFNHVVGVK